MSTSEVERIAQRIEGYLAERTHLPTTREALILVAQEIRERLQDRPEEIHGVWPPTHAVVTEPEQVEPYPYQYPYGVSPAPKEYHVFNINDVEARLAEGWRLQGGAVSKDEEWYQAMVR